MSAADKEEAKANQDIFWGAVMAWKQANTNKLLTFQGYPENLIGQSVLSECRHIILATDDVDAVEELSVVARKAMLSAGTPTDRFVVAVSTISMDAADTKELLKKLLIGLRNPLLTIPELVLRYTTFRMIIIMLMLYIHV